MPNLLESVFKFKAVLLCLPKRFDQFTHPLEDFYDDEEVFCDDNYRSKRGIGCMF